MRTDRDIENRKEIPKKARRLKSWYYPVKGFETIPQKLWKNIVLWVVKQSVTVALYLLRKRKSYRKRKSRRKGIFVKNVIWTASINELNNLLGANIPPVKYLDTLIICLTYNRKERVPRPFIYTYHPQEDLIFNRIYYPDHIYGKKNLPDREGICLELNDFAHLQNISDNEIIERAVNDVEKLGLFRKSELRHQHHFWLKECMPVYELDYEKN